MSVRNHNWYSLQSTRRYPLDENSTGISDDGQVIRDDILVDCHIRFPSTIGSYLYVQGVTVSPGIVTVLFGVVTELAAATGPTVAVLSLPKPVVPYVNYPVTAMLPGVSGWVVFGPGILTNFTGRYASPRQTLIAPKNGRGYRPLGVASLRKAGVNAGLEGVINIVGDLPIKVSRVANVGRVVDMTSGTKTIVKNAASGIVIELDTAQITADYNPLKQFLGPCGQRPESGTCDKTPIESINGILPDCNGNIDIEFGGLTGKLFDECGGVDVLTDVDLPTVCGAVNPPRTFKDNCCSPDLEVATEADIYTIPAASRTAGMLVKTTDTNNRFTLNADLITWTAAESEEYCAWPDPTAKIPDIIAEELPPAPDYPCLTTPFCVDFNTCNGAAPAFNTQYGTFLAASVLAPPPCAYCDINGNPLPQDPDNFLSDNYTLSAHNTYAATDSGNINIATLKNCATNWNIGQTVTTELRISSAGVERNGGLVLNFRRYLSALQIVYTTYIAVVIDSSKSQLRVLRYTNNSVTVESSVNVRIKTNTWYRLSATPNINGNNVIINAIVEEMTLNNPATANIAVNISATNYGAFTGAAGLFTSRAYTYFNKFTIT